LQSPGTRSLLIAEKAIAKYLYGPGVTKDIDEGGIWCQKAADQGDEAAKEELAKLNSNP
jgi:TPR repeat protein